MPSRLSEVEKAEARHLYLSDQRLSVDTVAEAFGVGRSVMMRVLEGITRPQGGRAKATLTTEQMAEMRNMGITLFQIGLQAGITESAVHRRLNRAAQAKE